MPRNRLFSRQTHHIQIVDKETLDFQPVQPLGLFFPMLEEYGVYNATGVSHELHDAARNASYNFVVQVKLGALYIQFLECSSAHPQGIKFEPHALGPSIPVIHSYFSTDNYLIVVHSPNKYNLLTLIGKRNVMSAIEKTNDPVRYYIFSKNTRRFVQTIEATDEPFVMQHRINSFEDPVTSELVLDMTSFSDWSLLARATVHILSTTNDNGDAQANYYGAVFRRVRLPSPVQTAERTAIRTVEFARKADFELPCINPNRDSMRYNFTYAIKNKTAMQQIHVYPTRLSSTMSTLVILFRLANRTIFVSASRSLSQDLVRLSKMTAWL